MSESELQMHDSGERRKFSTGAVRDTAAGKPRPDLISPIFERMLSEWLAKGAEKYDERNWEKGISLSASYASLRRHVLDWMDGKTDEPHMVAVACNAMFIIHTEEMIRRGRLPAVLADMPDYGEAKAIYLSEEDAVDLREMLANSKDMKIIQVKQQETTEETEAEVPDYTLVPVIALPSQAPFPESWESGPSRKQLPADDDLGLRRQFPGQRSKEELHEKITRGEDRDSHNGSYVPPAGRYVTPKITGAIAHN